MAEKKLEEMFNKVIISRYSPENKCNVKEGEILTIIPKERVPQKDYVSHNFVSIIDLKTKSQYGWVKEVKEFTIKSFIKMHYGEKDLKDEEREHIEIMLSSISKLQENTPVAATYSQKGFMDKKMVLKVHKVLFKN